MASAHLSLVLRRKGDRWRIRQYHGSRIVTDC
ncbi:nuclear transport factor 2 family protein [Streptomyces sp. NPDC051286]